VKKSSSGINEKLLQAGFSQEKEEAQAYTAYETLRLEKMGGTMVICGKGTVAMRGLGEYRLR